VDTYGSDVETAGNINTNGKIDHHGYSEITVPQKSYPQPVFPANLPNLTYNSSTGITSDGYYGSIKISSGTLVFYTNGRDLKVLVDNLDIKNLSINGGGRVLLFVNQSLSVFGNGSSSNDSDDLFIFGKAGSQMSFSGNSSFSGFIYAPSSSVTIKGTPGFKGSIIAGDVSCSGGASIIYDNSGDSVSSIKPFIGTSYKRIGWSSN
jgi:hypothetical protein